MIYISVTEAATQWNISKELVRRYCRQGRIPSAKYDEGNWLIPIGSAKPQRLNVPNDVPPSLSSLAKKLQNQKKKRNYHGLYDYVQTYLTYSSCRLASNRLTLAQIEEIFHTSKVSISFEPMKVSDLIEAQTHIFCIDYIIDHVQDALSPAFIKNLHHILTCGTVDERLGRVAPGSYRKQNYPSKHHQVDATQVANALALLIQEYESISHKTLISILDFHVSFETIAPFEDVNGRIGRLVLFKECLRHNVMPFIVDDKHRAQYLHGIRSWPSGTDTLYSLASVLQDSFESQIAYHKLLAKQQGISD